MVVGQFVQETDLVVIGGGAGGLAAALRAAELGVQTVLVRPDPDCDATTWAMIRRARDAMQHTEHAAELGLKLSKPKLDFPKLVASAQEQGTQRAARQEQHCQERGVDIVRGDARFEGARQVVVHDGTNARIRFKRAIIATGARALPPQGGWPESARVTHWHGAMRLDHVPKALLVLGGGPVAVELATGFAALGSNVSLVAPEERLLPEADQDLVTPVRERLAQRLEALCLAAEATRFRDLPHGVEVDFREEGNSWRRVFDHVIVALGARPDTDKLDLAKAKVELDDGGAIKVDDRLRTTNPRVYAAGDVTGPPFVESRAEAQGRVAAEVVAGRESAFDARAIPQVVHSDLPLAWCGLTEREAKAHDVPHTIASAGSTSEWDRLAKLILDPDSGLVLGVGMAGHGAIEVIGEAVLAIEMGAVAEDLAATVHPHPGLSGLIADAARGWPEPDT